MHHSWMPTRMENWRRVNNFDFPRCWWFLQTLKRYISDIHRFGIFSIRKAMNYKYYNTLLASEIMINAQWICGKVWLLVWPRDYKLLVQRWQLQKKKAFSFLFFIQRLERSDLIQFNFLFNNWHSSLLCACTCYWYQY